uniref:Ankyrin repeat and sterile alpha motif domain containing 1B n=1 Tax=Tetraodon nigroviridis TaxID=99883 RepID=H3DND5_TETNG
LCSMWKGLNVNCTDSSGYTPLHHASLNGHRDVVLKLLQYEASTNVEDNKGCFPLHLAAWRGDVDIVRILIHHGPSHCRVNQQRPSANVLTLEEGREAGSLPPSVLPQNHEKETALHCAAQYGHSDVVSVLLHELTDPTMRNSRQETPLDLAALYGRLEVVCMLINTHPNLMTCHCRRHTPLHLAARNGHHSTVQTLLQAGMDVNCLTDNGSALHEAALFGKMDVVRLLLDSGIKTNLRDSQGRTALEILREHPAQKSQQITALIQGCHCTGTNDPLIGDQKGHARTPTPTRTYAALPLSDDAVTSELSKLLHEIKKCRDRDYSFEELCQTISSHSMDSFGSGRLSDEERPDRPNGTLTRVFKPEGLQRPTPPVAPALEEDEAEKSDPKYSSEIVTSPSLDVFLPEDEDNPYESVTTAVTRKPCSLDISHRLNACPGNERNRSAEDRRKSHIPEEFAGLLHGSSPACETLETPYHLYSPKPHSYASTDPQSGLLQAPEFSVVIGGGPRHPFSRTGAESNPGQTEKPQVVYRTIFHTQVNQGSGYEERACTLGRMRSMPRSVLDLQLSKSLSKSDSNLVAVSPIQEEHSWGSGSREHGAGSLSPGEGTSPGGRLERTPSFTAEWEEIDKIMSSIGAGIRSGLDFKEENSGSRASRMYGEGRAGWRSTIWLQKHTDECSAPAFMNDKFQGSNVVEDQDLREGGMNMQASKQRWGSGVQLPRLERGLEPEGSLCWLASSHQHPFIFPHAMSCCGSVAMVTVELEAEAATVVEVLKISLIGHRKRILASLGDRLHEDTPQKPPRAISLREPGNQTPPQLSPSVGQAAYTAGVPGGSLDVQHLIMQADARRRQRSNDNYFEDVPRSKLERQMAQAGEWCEPITLRPPNEATSSTPVQYWQHHPEKLIFQSCDYEAYYLGSMLVKELRGESTQDACAKMRKSTEQMKKVPTIVLSVSYKGVKFIDATNKNIIAEHEIRNISCAAQDPEDLSTFAYITKDLKSSHHYCHVFTAFDVNLAYEIILTLGQAFEVAYQLALQARKSGHGSSTLPESFDSKPSKPVPKPRVNIRKSMEQPSMDQKGHANVPWIVEPGQEAKRGVNTK